MVTHYSRVFMWWCAQMLPICFEAFTLVPFQNELFIHLYLMSVVRQVVYGAKCCMHVRWRQPGWGTAWKSLFCAILASTFSQGMVLWWGNGTHGLSCFWTKLWSFCFIDQDLIGQLSQETKSPKQNWKTGCVSLQLVLCPEMRTMWKEKHLEVSFIQSIINWLVNHKVAIA